MIRVLITGASGHLGRKLFDYLEERENYEVIGLDICCGDHSHIHHADLTKSGTWEKYLEGIDVLVHLAADREPTASWESAINNNMNATLDLFHTAVKKGIKRVVFASSNWLHGGYRFSDEKLTPALAPFPVNAYGVAKLFGERAGHYFSTHHDLSVICLRIGWTQWTHNNQPGEHMGMGRWGQEMWLSDDDFISGAECAIVAPNVPYAVLNLMSDNQGMRWDIETTRKIIGYKPTGRAIPYVPLFKNLQSWVFGVLVIRLPRFFARKMNGW